MRTSALITTLLAVGLIPSAALRAGGILPDRINQIIIQGRFDPPQPEFVVVFSAHPLTDSNGRQVASLSARELSALETTEERVVLKLYGKAASEGTRLD